MNADWQSFVIASAAKASKSRVQSPKRNPENANQPLERFRRSDLRTPAGGKGKDRTGPRPVCAQISPKSIVQAQIIMGMPRLSRNRTGTRPHRVSFRHDHFPLWRCAFAHCGRKSTSCLAVAKTVPVPSMENSPKPRMGSPYACRQPPGSKRRGGVRSRSGRAGHLGAPSWLSPFRAGCVEKER